MTEFSQTKNLWKECFKDSDNFINLYFEKRYTPQRNMAVYEKDKLIAALQMIPYQMKFFDKHINASYISGAATTCESRKQGVMSSLLKNTHRRMYDDGVVLSFLIPADKNLFDYYSNFGYRSIFKSYLKQVHIEKGERKHSVDIDLIDYIDDKIYDYFSHKMESIQFSVQHDFEDLSIVVEDIKLSGGKVVVAYNEGKICGIAFAVKDDDRLFVKEIMADTNEIVDELIYKILDFFQEDMFFIRVNNYVELFPYGMARAINLEVLMKIWAQAHKEKNVTIEVRGDIDIPENNGKYYIYEGNVYHFDFGADPDEFLSRNKGIDDSRIERYNINEVVDLLFDGTTPYMSLMMD